MGTGTPQDALPPLCLRWWRGLLRRGAGWMRRHVFERGDFRDTGQAVMLKDIGLESPDRYRYVPSGRSVIPRLLRKLKAGPDDVFLDVGSGKGRAVFQAARSPLKRVIGLELAGEFNEVARYNVEHDRDRLKCQNVELISGDAVEYTFPDDIMIAFFYRPFSGKTFERVIDKPDRIRRPQPARASSHLRLSDDGRLRSPDRALRRD